VIADLRRWAAVGVQRVMCQMLDMTDLEAMDLIAREVIPEVRR
jgi:hypothetical protein